MGFSVDVYLGMNTRLASRYPSSPQETQQYNNICVLVGFH